jgi:hypothetical protein
MSEENNAIKAQISLKMRKGEEVKGDKKTPIYHTCKLYGEYTGDFYDRIVVNTKDHIIKISEIINFCHTDYLDGMTAGLEIEACKWEVERK